MILVTNAMIELPILNLVQKQKARNQESTQDRNKRQIHGMWTSSYDPQYVLLRLETVLHLGSDKSGKALAPANRDDVLFSQGVNISDAHRIFIGD